MRTLWWLQMLRSAAEQRCLYMLQIPGQLQWSHEIYSTRVKPWRNLSDASRKYIWRKLSEAGKTPTHLLGTELFWIIQGEFLCLPLKRHQVHRKRSIFFNFPTTDSAVISAFESNQVFFSNLVQAFKDTSCDIISFFNNLRSILPVVRRCMSCGNTATFVKPSASMISMGICPNHLSLPLSLSSLSALCLEALHEAQSPIQTNLCSLWRD